MTVATVVIPTFNHGRTLIYSVGSALDQTVQDIEVFIVGDGVPEVTREIVADLVKKDERVRFFDNPKGPRHGEIYRHQALAEARGRIVCYLSDDDLWLPDHVETLCDLLGEADYAHTLVIQVGGEGRLGALAFDLSYPGEREGVLAGHKGTSLSCMAHTLEMYRRLPFGWRTTPIGMYTDRYMQQQFLAQPSCRAVSSTRPTMVHFKSPERNGWSIDERIAELEEWRRKLAEPEARNRFVYEVLDVVIREQVAMRHRFDNSVGLRLYNLLGNLPLIGPAIKFIARGGAPQSIEPTKQARHRARR